MSVDKRDVTYSWTKLQRVNLFLYENSIWIRCLTVLFVLTPFVLWVLQNATHKYCYMPPATHVREIDFLVFVDLDTGC